MGKLIGPMQSASILGRAISNNILLAQNLLCNFHQKSGGSRMCIKPNLVKAFNSSRWEFLNSTLHAMNFHEHMTSLIMMYISEPHFSILVNGQAVRYFRGTHGLRQWFPLCLYLFTIVMEFLYALMNKYVASMMIPSPYTRNDTFISYIMFADDLIILVRALQ